MVLHDYVTSSGRNVIIEYIESLTQNEIVDAYSVRELMEKNRFDELHCKPWEKKVYEVYFYKHNRIFYVIPDGENIYLLHACRKQKNKTEKGDAKIVRKRAKEIGEMLGKKFI